MRSAFPALAAAAFVAGVNLRLFDALLPKVADDFGVLPTSASIVVTAFTLAYGLFQIVHGPLGDRLGKLRVIWAATLVAAAASLASALAPSLRVLAATRFATGIGAAAIIPLALAWLGDNSEFKVRQAVVGRFVGFLLLGQALGPAFGGALAQLFSWREVFFVLAAIFLLVALALFGADRRTRAATPQRHGTGVLRDYVRVLGDPWVRTMMVTGFIEGALFFGVFTYAGAYLRERFALSYLAVGVIVACYALGGVVYSLLVRWLLTKMSERWFVGLGAGGPPGVFRRPAPPAGLAGSPAGLPGGRVRLLPAAQHPADPGHRDGAGGQGHGTLRVRVQPLHRPGGRRPARCGGHPDRGLPLDVHRSRAAAAGDGVLVLGKARIEDEGGVNPCSRR